MPYPRLRDSTQQVELPGGPYRESPHRPTAGSEAGGPSRSCGWSGVCWHMLTLVFYEQAQGIC